jgi:hypothetical protein
VIEAPESLDEAARLAKASAIIGQIGEDRSSITVTSPMSVEQMGASVRLAIGPCSTWVEIA